MSSATLSGRLAQWAKELRSGTLPVPTVGCIPVERCRPSGSIGQEIEKNEAYFSIVLNELYLAQGRSWWAAYDPMALVISEFQYGGENVTIPSVVGPAMIKQKMGQLPHGFVLNDTRATGPYPFRGGNVAVTVILYRVKHQDYAAGLLRFIEGVSSAVGASTEMMTFNKVGAALLDGVNTLLNMRETEPVCGQRVEIDTSDIGGLRSSCSVLIAQGGLDLRQLWVENRRLRIAGGDAALAPFTSSDYVLYSITRTEARGDEEKLPYFDLRMKAVNDALSADEDRWKRAKATMLILYEQMLASPDLTEKEVGRLFRKYREDLLQKRQDGFDLRAMSEPKDGQPRALDARLRERVALLDL